MQHNSLTLKAKGAHLLAGNKMSAKIKSVQIFTACSTVIASSCCFFLYFV